MHHDRPLDHLASVEVDPPQTLKMPKMPKMPPQMPRPALDPTLKDALNAVLHCGLRRREKFILVALLAAADRGISAGVSVSNLRVSVQSLSDQTNYERRLVRMSLRLLCSQGVLREVDPHRQRRATAYAFDLTKLPTRAQRVTRDPPATRRTPSSGSPGTPKEQVNGAASDPKKPDTSTPSGAASAPSEQVNGAPTTPKRRVGSTAAGEPVTPTAPLEVPTDPDKPPAIRLDPDQLAVFNQRHTGIPHGRVDDRKRRAGA